MPEWKIAGYTELRALGSGGFGDAVLARHDRSGTLVAIKYLHYDLLADPEFAEMFRAEARVLASLNDPNVVRLYEYVESPAGAAIVMELIDGVSVRQILSRQGATTAEAALVVLQGSLLGLAAAHRRGVVHRDYKPENVLVNAGGVSKLSDFGIAARAGDRAIPAGTLAYAPPEQFAGAAATPAGDVYAAMATFYECLTGRPPFTGTTAEHLLYQHQAAPVPLDPVPEPLRPLVEAGMAKDPGRRPADAGALVVQLRTVAAGAYGEEWEERGRSHLGAAALLLAALWPSGAAPAAQGATLHRVLLRRRLPHGHIGTAKAAVAVGVAAAVAAVVVVALPGSKGIAPAPAVPGGLEAVAATSDSSAWAVGCDPAGHCTKTVIMRLDGGTWTQLPGAISGPFVDLDSVAATSDGGAWAAGFTGSGTSSRTLILRLDGTTWTQVPTPSPGMGDELLGVTATSGGTAWAAGYTESSVGEPHPLILRWNGTAWTQVPVPDEGYGELSGVTAVSADDAWAFGYSIASSASVLAHGVTLILHWNGATWTRVPSPSSGLDSNINAVAAVSADSAWAIGYTDTSHSENALLLRWNGTSWTLLPNPAPAGTYPIGVSASAGTAWAIGTVSPPGCRAITCIKTVLLRWNGTAWMRVPTPGSPGTYLAGIAALSGHDALAVGGRDGKTLILRWNGTSWN